MEHLLQATNLAPTPEPVEQVPVAPQDPTPDPDAPRTRTSTRQSTAARPPGPWTKERRARWTKDEDDELIALVRVSPPLTWGQIAEGISTERASAGCMMRWYNHVRKVAGDVARIEPAGSVSPDQTSTSASPDPSTTSHPRRWTPADDTALLAAVAQHGRKWDAVAAALSSGEGRSVRAYRERWQKLVKAQGEEDEDEDDEGSEDEDADGSEDEGVDLEAVLNAAPPPGEQGAALTIDWSPQDDAQLIYGVSADPPLTWYQIGERMNPPRLGAECLKRWYHSGKALAPHVIRVEPLPGQLVPTHPRAPVPAPYLQTPYTMPHIPSLPSTALVTNPPIPFQPNSVIRGRRTLSPSALAGTLFSPKGRQRKVHCCPAENCGAAFKRSEHLKRHYRAVHVGAKPFPCQWSSCGKSFSRKDNLQQHMSMVHGSPVPGSSAGTPNFKTKRASRAAPKTAPKAPPIKQEEREASSSGSSSSDSPEREEGMRGEPERKRIRMEEGRAGTGSEEEEKVEAEESYERTRC